VDILQKKWTDITKKMFTRIGSLIKKLLNLQYTQEMLMENQPIPLFDVIELIIKEIEKA
jgi:hypothetical protein